LRSQDAPPPELLDDEDDDDNIDEITLKITEKLILLSI